MGFFAQLAMLLLSFVVGFIAWIVGGFFSVIIGRKIDSSGWLKSISRAIPDWIFLTLAIPMCFIIGFLLIYYFNF